MLSRLNLNSWMLLNLREQEEPFLLFVLLLLEKKVARKYSGRQVQRSQTSPQQ